MRGATLRVAQHTARSFHRSQVSRCSHKIEVVLLRLHRLLGICVLLAMLAPLAQRILSQSCVGGRQSSVTSASSAQTKDCAMPCCPANSNAGAIQQRTPLGFAVCLGLQCIAEPADLKSDTALDHQSSGKWTQTTEPVLASTRSYCREDLQRASLRDGSPLAMPLRI